MAAVTIVLSDTPTGGIAVYTDFVPAIGHPISPAQSAALEMINRTKKHWGIPLSRTTTATARAVLTPETPTP